MKSHCWDLLTMKVPNALVGDVLEYPGSVYLSQEPQGYD